MTSQCINLGIGYGEGHENEVGMKKLKQETPMGSRIGKIVLFSSRVHCSDSTIDCSDLRIHCTLCLQYCL